MTEVLSWLLAAQEQSVAELHSAPKMEIGPFLRGETNKIRSTISDNNDCSSFGYALNHHRVPLAIVSENIFSLSTVYSREMLRAYFEDGDSSSLLNSKEQQGGGGFEKVFTLRLAEDNGARSYTDLSDAARFSCLSAVETAVKSVISTAREDCRKFKLSPRPLKRRRVEEDHCDALSNHQQCDTPSQTLRSELSANSSLPSCKLLFRLGSRKKERRADTRNSIKLHRFLIAIHSTVAARQSMCCVIGAAKKNNNSVRRHFGQGTDPLMRFLSDIVSLNERSRAALRAVSSLIHTHDDTQETNTEGSTIHRLHFAVILIPCDDIFGCVKLSHRLQPFYGKEMVIKCFEGRNCQPLRCSRGKNDEDAGGGAEDHFDPQEYRPCEALHILTWMDSVSESPTCTCSESAAAVKKTMRLMKGQEDYISKLLLSDHLYYFMRESNLLLSLFMYSALQLFPVILSSDNLLHIQKRWSSRHRLEDVVYAFHAMLMPFGFSMESKSNSSHHLAASENIFRDTNPTSRILNALYQSAENLSLETATKILESNQYPNGVCKRQCSLHLEVIYFNLLYEGLCCGYFNRLLCTPDLVAFFSSFTLDSNDETNLKLSLEKIHDNICDRNNNASFKEMHSLSPCDASADDTEKKEALDVIKAVLLHCSLHESVSGSAVSDDLGFSITIPLRRSALFAALSPHVSATQLTNGLSHRCTNSESGQTPLRLKGTYPLPRVSGEHEIAVNNFFSRRISREVRVMHVLTASACAAMSGYGGGGRMRTSAAHLLTAVPLSYLQWATQMSDEGMLEVLEVLRDAKFLHVDARSCTASSLLVEGEALESED